MPTHKNFIQSLPSQHQNQSSDSTKLWILLILCSPSSYDKQRSPIDLIMDLNTDIFATFGPKVTLFLGHLSTPRFCIVFQEEHLCKLQPHSIATGICWIQIYDLHAIIKIHGYKSGMLGRGSNTAVIYKLFLKGCFTSLIRNILHSFT